MMSVSPELKTAQCLHYVRTTSHEGYMYVSPGRCCADIVRTYISRDICVRTMSALNLSSVFSSKDTDMLDCPLKLLGRRSGYWPAIDMLWFLHVCK